MLSGQQQSIFQPLKNAAWLKHCEQTGTPPNGKGQLDAWYRKELVGSLGVYTTKEIKANDLEMFDKLCMHFATLTGDAVQIEYWSSADERRAMWRLECTMKNAGVGWNYVQGIARKMGLVVDGDLDKIKNLPAEHLLKINTAVYLFYKRHQPKETKHAETPF